MSIRGIRPGGVVRLLELTLPPEWVTHALCAQTDPEAFYPEKGGSTRQPKSVCRSCPVMAECRDYALANGEMYGVWGGLSENDRRRLRRQARRTATPVTELGAELGRAA